ncbi:MAG: sulfatase [Alphaproteobacteria bacterium]|nr:sulfatase [Alphaproteobacteria bacterium]
MVDRRNLIKLGLAAPALLGTPARAGRARRRAGKPNLIHICADDMRYDDFALMPNLRRIFRHAGIKFGRHTVSFSLCAPSRAGMLTGLQAHNHGVLGNRKGGYEVYRTLEDNALPVWLTNAGYFVGHVGKFINNYGKIAPKHVPPGYADWRAMASEKLDYTDFLLNENGTLVDYDHGEYTTEVFTQKALNFLGMAPEPFALFFWPNAPHLPATPAEQDKGSFANVDMPITPNFNEADVSDKPRAIRDLPLLTPEEIAAVQDIWRSRAECLQSLDRGIAAIVSALTTAGQLENTHIVFTSDNGFLLGEHRVGDDKDLVYEESTRVPLVWRMPGGAAGARDNPVTNIDVTAAFVELSGASAGRVLDGRSLVPLLMDAKAPWNTAVLLQCTQTRGLATQHYRYAVWPETGETELYDLSTDPYELQNRSGTHEYRKVEADLAQAFAALDQCEGTGCAWTGKFPRPPK